MKNWHKLQDRILLLLTKVVGEKFFKTSIETADFEDHIAAVDFDLPDITGLGEHHLKVQSLQGQVETSFKVLKWTGPEAPTVIYHQGGAEIPYYYTAARMYPEDMETPYNVIAVRAPFQQTHKEMKVAFRHLSNYLTMMAIPVVMTEKLITSASLKGGVKIVSGYSLGGFVTNRHHMMYDTAEAYVPFMAGTCHGDIFLTTVPASKIAVAQPDYIRQKLNFDAEWQKKKHPNVFPVLGEKDLLNKLEMQLPSYGDMPVDIWEGAHMYGVIRPHLIREKIEYHLKECSSPSA